MKHNANLDVKGVVIGSTASISSLNAIQGISAGANSISIGTLVLSNSNNISFGISGQTITASSSGTGAGRGTVSIYPSPGYGLQVLSILSTCSFSGAGGSTTTTVERCFVSPLHLPADVVYNQVEGLANVTLGGGTCSNSIGVYYGLYSITESTLSRALSYCFNLLHSETGNATRTFSWWWGTRSTTNSTSTNGDVTSLFNASRIYLLETNAGSTLTAGDYHLVVLYTHSSANANILGFTPIGMAGTSTQTTHSIIAKTWGQTQATQFDSVGRYWGYFSTTSADSVTQANMLPASFNTSIVSATDFPHQIAKPTVIIWRST